MLPRLMDALDRCTLYILQPQGLMCNVVLLRSSADEVGFTGSGATCCAFESKCALCVHVYNCSMGSGAEGAPHVMKPLLQLSSCAQLAAFQEEDNQS